MIMTSTTTTIIININYNEFILIYFEISYA